MWEAHENQKKHLFLTERFAFRMMEQTGGSADDRVIAFAATLELLLSTTSGEAFTEG